MKLKLSAFSTQLLRLCIPGVLVAAFAVKLHNSSRKVTEVVAKGAEDLKLNADR